MTPCLWGEIYGPDAWDARRRWEDHRGGRRRDRRLHSGQAAGRITELLAAGVYDIIIDMLDVEFLDSSGLGVLVGALKKVRAHNGSLQLICNQNRVLKIFRITGLAEVFVIHESADAALVGN